MVFRSPNDACEYTVAFSWSILTDMLRINSLQPTTSYVTESKSGLNMTWKVKDVTNGRPSLALRMCAADLHGLFGWTHYAQNANISIKHPRGDAHSDFFGLRAFVFKKSFCSFQVKWWRVFWILLQSWLKCFGTLEWGFNVWNPTPLWILIFSVAHDSDSEKKNTDSKGFHGRSDGRWTVT